MAWRAARILDAMSAQPSTAPAAFPWFMRLATRKDGHAPEYIWQPSKKPGTTKQLPGYRPQTEEGPSKPLDPEGTNPNCCPVPRAAGGCPLVGLACRRSRNQDLKRTREFRVGVIAVPFPASNRSDGAGLTGPEAQTRNSTRRRRDKMRRRPSRRWLEAEKKRNRNSFQWNFMRWPALAGWPASARIFVDIVSVWSVL